MQNSVFVQESRANIHLPSLLHSRTGHNTWIPTLFKKKWDGLLFLFLPFSLPSAFWLLYTTPSTNCRQLSPPLSSPPPFSFAVNEACACVERRGEREAKKQLWILFCSPSCVRPNYSVIAARAWGGGGGGVGRASFPEKKGNFRTTPDISRGGERPTKKKGKTLFSPPPPSPCPKGGNGEKGPFYYSAPPLFLRRIVCGRRKRGRGGGSQKSNWLPPSLFPLTPCDMTLKRMAKERATQKASVAAAVVRNTYRDFPHTHTPFVIVAMFEFWEGKVGGG